MHVQTAKNLQDNLHKYGCINVCDGGSNFLKFTQSIITHAVREKKYPHNNHT